MSTTFRDPDSPFYGMDNQRMGNFYRDLLGLVLSKSGPLRITEADIHAYRASELGPFMYGEGKGWFELSLVHEDDL